MATPTSEPFPLWFLVASVVSKTLSRERRRTGAWRRLLAACRSRGWKAAGDPPTSISTNSNKRRVGRRAMPSTPAPVGSGSDAKERCPPAATRSVTCWVFLSALCLGSKEHFWPLHCSVAELHSGVGPTRVYTHGNRSSAPGKCRTRKPCLLESAACDTGHMYPRHQYEREATGDP